MKAHRILLLLILAHLFVLNVFSQYSDLSRKVIASLQPAESLLYGENCFYLASGKEGLLFITATDENPPSYYVYDQGKRSGPFEATPYEILEKCTENSRFCGAFDQTLADLDESVVEPAGEKSYFVNRGKKYGPYEGILSVYRGKDGKSYAAQVMNDSKMYFVDDSGKETQISGNINEMVVSPDCMTFFAKVQGTVSLLELSNMNTQDQEALSKVFEDLEKHFMYLPGGDRLGPFTGDEIYGLNCWFSAINPNHWFCSVSHDIFLNDNKLCTLENMPSQCDFWVNQDGKKYAWANYENLCLDNGQCYPFPLAVNYYVENKQGFLTWVCVENGQDVVWYKTSF